MRNFCERFEKDSDGGVNGFSEKIHQFIANWTNCFRFRSRRLRFKGIIFEYLHQRFEKGKPQYVCTWIMCTHQTNARENTWKRLQTDRRTSTNVFKIIPEKNAKNSLSSSHAFNCQPYLRTLFLPLFHSLVSLASLLREKVLKIITQKISTKMRKWAKKVARIVSRLTGSSTLTDMPNFFVFQKIRESFKLKCIKVSERGFSRDT